MFSGLEHRANLVWLGRLINRRDFLCVPTNMSDLATFVAFLDVRLALQGLT